MNQTRWESFKEVLQNILVGYVFGLVSQILLFPLVDINVSLATNLELSVYFTLVSIARMYIIRRWHNAKLRRKFLKEQPDERCTGK
jgi:nicotinamide riboside transporter PnuC